MEFTAFNYRVQRDIAVAINGFPVEQFALTPRGTRDLTLDLDIPPQMNVLTLTSPQPPVSVDPSDGRDNRLLSFGLRQVRVQQISG